MNKKKNMLVILLVTLMVFLSDFSLVYAADGYRNIKAWFGDINILNNGEKIGDHVPKFMVDGLIYVPIQKVGEIFDKNWSWDQVTHTMRFTDNPSKQNFNQKQNNMMMFMRLFEKEEKIKELEEKVKTLETKLEGKKEVTDLDDLEKDIKDKYDEIDDVEVNDIDLDDKGNDVEVKIEIDLDKDEREWKRVSESELEDYLENIYDEIKYAVEDLDDVKGEIETKSRKYDDIEFIFNSRGQVRFDLDNDSVNDLENELEDEYDKIDDEVRVDFELRGDKDKIYVDIQIESDHEDDDFDDLSRSDVENYIKDLCRDILDEFDDADIDGKIEDSDGYKEVKFDVDLGYDLDIDW
ncbi:stalk domain-containing protein [Dethiothermospora halolimnae]|uniref:stalk domain-containing protein n=1 Tax=Dethiothermospora halolimnae TaxID=3114390 RepID=UPI003CCC1A1A